MVATTVLFTGYSGAGKTTIAMACKKYLDKKAIPSVVLDGDVMRQGVCKYLGFSREDRLINVTRIAEVAKVLVDNGTIALVSIIAPFEDQRDMFRDIVGNMKLVYVSRPFTDVYNNDIKGLYAKASNGEIINFTGMSSPYEAPDCPDLILKTDTLTVEDCVKKVYRCLVKNK